MSYLHDEIDDDQPNHLSRGAQAREMTLSTGMILGIFFGLALLCAVFFGFGYSMGSKSRQAPIVNADGSTAASTTDFNSFKPAAGAPVGSSSAPKVSAAPTVVVETPAQAPIVRTAPAASTPITNTSKPVEAAPVAAVHSAPANETGLTFTVQVAAVSHQEDADLLVAALKRKNYSVVARTEAQDKLYHIQIGPFAAKKDADAMRQRLLGDGYNAIVK
jgi:cell division septation protein DedD